MQEFNNRYAIEKIIRRTGAYYISAKTLLEIEFGCETSYGLKPIKIRPCLAAFTAWLDSGFDIVDSNIKDHKKIVSIR
jgi:hypothetical protein